ncbi:hypothetical protein E6W39_17555 [Kitasatospora acidiphila]|uniref:Uncharacterized protein n=1 Tax=Kitasatospora acidiphila TaxID=2567942 RepID=A0A540W3U3_9ACTN|nr:hypothetical protein [Kitasatospora acidiphila]TQF03706.1 hypothetical protein E6W39_17555 [Kitasatospora acidiphila]
MIHALNEFSVNFTYRHRETTWLIHRNGSDAPVARLRKPEAPDSLKPYQVYGGPQLDELLGHVANSIALAPDGRRLGRVRLRSKQWGLRDGLSTDEEWTFAQDGLGELHGQPMGLGSRARHAFVVGNLMDNVLTDVVLAHSLRYRSIISEGFELTRRPGVNSRYDVRVHDPRINRLLVLSAVSYFESEHGDADVRKILPSIGGLFRL